MKKIAILLTLISVSGGISAMRPLVRCASPKPKLICPQVHSIARLYSDQSQPKTGVQVIARLEERIMHYEKKQKEHMQMAEQHENYAKIYSQLAEIEIEEYKSPSLLNNLSFDEVEKYKKALSEKKTKLLKDLPVESDKNSN